MPGSRLLPLVVNVVAVLVAFTGFGVSGRSSTNGALVQNLECFKVLMSAVGNFTEFCKVCDPQLRLGIYNL